MTGLAAARKTSVIPQNSSVDNYLVIYQTMAPESQCAEFVQAIERMAGALEAWHKIVYLNNDDMLYLQELAAREGWAAACGSLAAKIGVDRIDELYLSKSRMLGNQLLLQTYRAARKICYGDGIGLNFSRRYFGGGSAELPVKESFSKEELLQLAVSMRQVRPEMGGDCFDQYCLLLPNLFDETMSTAVLQPDKAVFRELFAQLAPATGDASIARVLSRLETAESMVFILTCNFSEFGKMSLVDEVAAYREFVAMKCAPGSTLVIKPHPRDSYQKLSALTDELLKDGWEVLLLGAQDSLYLPFEAIISRCLEFQQWLSKIKILTFSTSCLSLEAIFGMPCTRGFGADIVQQRFFSASVESRLRHERDLSEAVARIAKNLET